MNLHIDIDHNDQANEWMNNRNEYENEWTYNIVEEHDYNTC